jgi:predicted lipoprotein with Yx(FWY)xxD motif
VSGKSTYAFALLALAAALAIAGCGGSGGSSGSGGGAYGGKASSESTSAEETTSGGESTSASSAGGAYAAPAESSGGGGEAAVISLASAPKLGLILVDSKGLTVYDFHKDKGTESSCYGACEQGWPPVISAGEPQVGNGASASKLGTTERKDGTMQVTYAGHPLYTFVEDKKPGEANGNDVSAFGAQWYALKGSGEEAGG